MHNNIGGYRMSIRLRGLEPGDILISKINEAYLYLGKYEGRPRSMYQVPDKGYLYLFLGHLYGMCDKVTPILNSPRELEKHIRQIMSLSFDGFCRYTKNPVTFENKIGHFDLDNIALSIRYIHGMSRIGDK